MDVSCPIRSINKIGCRGNIVCTLAVVTGVFVMWHGRESLYVPLRISASEARELGSVTLGAVDQPNGCTRSLQWLC